VSPFSIACGVFLVLAFSPEELGYIRLKHNIHSIIIVVLKHNLSLFTFARLLWACPYRCEVAYHILYTTVYNVTSAAGNKTELLSGCCGHIPYDVTTEWCCDEVQNELPQLARIEPNHTYSCCGNRVMTLSKGEVCNYCGAREFDARKQVCCGTEEHGMVCRWVHNYAFRIKSLHWIITWHWFDVSSEMTAFLLR